MKGSRLHSSVRGFFVSLTAYISRTHTFGVLLDRGFWFHGGTRRNRLTDGLVGAYKGVASGDLSLYFSGRCASLVDGGPDL